MSESRTFTEEEHFALLTAAVERETSDLDTALEASKAQVAELENKVDVLTAERDTLSTEVEQAKAEFEDFKSELQRAEELDTLRSQRAGQVREAHSNLAEDYFTEDRVNRWAEMTDEQFASFMEDLAAVTPAKETSSEESAPTTAAFSGTTETKTPTLRGFLASRI